MARLNYHHLYYFWRVAKQGNLTETAERLHLSQSALSTQIKKLEAALGQALFKRVGRRLELTESGRVALDYAEPIFNRGDELLATLREGRGAERQVIRIGAMATLSRNFQEGFIGPLMDRSDISLVLQSGRLDDLLGQLSTHRLDLVLSNTDLRSTAETPWRSRRIARQAVSVLGRPRAKPFRLPDDLADARVLLPGEHSEIRTAVDMYCERWGMRPHILAEVDDMAMLRLLARDTDAISIMPPVVVRDEIADGTLVEYAQLPNVHENFYAISVKRYFQNPLIAELLAREPHEIMAD
ncbi:MAG: LysR family transcriptional regulator [Salinisphaera sp.]|jgi:LysR family transcriptional activator of nhaA|nr:LysR family transcriptional regulator [Salinisphaera sp.]